MMAPCRVFIIRLTSGLRAVSLFSWSVEQNARDTQMTTRVTKGASLTESEEKEILFAVYLI